MTSPVRALIVDDEPDMCWALERILEPEGYSVHACTTAAEALETLQREPFDLVFLDAKLPDAEGAELCSRIKSIRKETCIFLLSGYFYQNDAAVRDLLRKGVIAGFLGKPFDAADVRDQARKALEAAGRKKGKKR